MKLKSILQKSIVTLLLIIAVSTTAFASESQPSDINADTDCGYSIVRLAEAESSQNRNRSIYGPIVAEPVVGY